jgi:hypothetical protein
MAIVTEERSLAGHTGVGEVVITGATGSPEVGRLAAGRAWLAVTAALVDGGDPGAACAAASAGLDELGSAYAVDEVEDDTTLKLLRAEDLQEEDPARGAVALQRVLENRVAMLADRLGGAVAG